MINRVVFGTHQAPKMELLTKAINDLKHNLNT